jgi:hypothetical protein
LATPADSARVASDPHRALEATGCHGLSSPSTLACARAATPTRVPVRTDEDAGSSSEEPAPKPRRPRTRDMYSRRTNALPNGSSHRRCRRRRPGAFVGWRPLTRKRAVRDPARRPWRRGATFDPTRCSEPAPHEPCPKTEHAWRSSTDHRNRSPLRGPLATHLVELLGGVATSSLSVPRIVRQLTPRLKSRTTLTTRRPSLPDAIPGLELTPSGHLAVTPRHPS